MSRWAPGCRHRRSPRAQLNSHGVEAIAAEVRAGLEEVSGLRAQMNSHGVEAIAAEVRAGLEEVSVVASNVAEAPCRPRIQKGYKIYKRATYPDQQRR
jgi:hypothetical protein